MRGLMRAYRARVPAVPVAQGMSRHAQKPGKGLESLTVQV
jgi:hypothetical protein